MNNNSRNNYNNIYSIWLTTPLPAKKTMSHLIHAIFFIVTKDNKEEIFEYSTFWTQYGNGMGIAQDTTYFCEKTIVGQFSAYKLHKV